MYRQDWPGLNPTSQRLVALAGVFDILLLVAALSDLSRRGPEEINGNKTIWKLVVWVDFLGPGAYFLFGRKRQ
ncbi:MAG: PLDc N-terminal domain-containing protein [Anaerolineales bacterium]